MIPLVNNKPALPWRAGNPDSAKPIAGLSKRAQKLLQPRKQCFCTPIEPAGSGLARQVMLMDGCTPNFSLYLCHAQPDL